LGQVKEILRDTSNLGGDAGFVGPDVILPNVVHDVPELTLYLGYLARAPT